MNERKVALITGANKGLGLEIARQLGNLDHTVVLGARDLAKGEAAAEGLRIQGIDAHAVQLEVTNADDVAALLAYLNEKFGRLDVLVNNAGVQFDFEGEVTIDTLRRTFEANTFAPFAITQAVLPLLKASPAGRIVNHSSILGSITSIANGAGGAWTTAGYTSSKAALNMLTVVQAHELKGTNVKVNSAHPGWVRTDLGTDAAPMNVEQGAKTAVWLATLPEDGPTGGFFHGHETLPW